MALEFAAIALSGADDSYRTRFVRYEVIMPPATKRRCDADLSSRFALTALIDGLHSLRDGPAYVNRLIAYGREATPALADFLLKSNPSGVPEARQWAVEALGGLGAYDVLLEYLRNPLKTRDPVVRQGEDAVPNTAARELASCHSDSVFPVLLDLLRTRPLPGVVETLGAYRRKEAAPYLIDCLEDDVCRAAAMDALRNLGDAVRLLLTESAITRKPGPPDNESRSSLQRRRCCLKLLEPLRLTREEVSRLEPLMHEKDPDTVIAVVQLLMRGARFTDYRSIRSHLHRVRKSLGWWLCDEFRTLLAKVEGRLSLDENSHHL